jgi:hypothetical protein
MPKVTPSSTHAPPDPLARPASPSTAAAVATARPAPYGFKMGFLQDAFRDGHETKKDEMDRLLRERDEARTVRRGPSVVLLADPAHLRIMM